MQEFLPKTKIWKVKDKKFTQESLSVEQVFNVAGVLIEILDKLSDDEDDVKKLDSLDLTSPVGFTMAFGMMTKKAKGLAYKAIGIVLNTEDPDDIEYIRKNLKFYQLSGIIRELFAQNNVKEIRKDFLGAVAEWKVAGEKKEKKEESGKK